MKQIAQLRTEITQMQSTLYFFWNMDNDNNYDDLHKINYMNTLSIRRKNMTNVHRNRSKVHVIIIIWIKYLPNCSVRRLKNVKNFLLNLASYELSHENSYATWVSLRESLGNI